MNTLKILSFALISTFVLFSCKEEETTTSKVKKTSEKEIALAQTTPIENPSVAYLYVTASTGLSLREHANLQSEKLAVMPYGTRVKVISSEEKPTMAIGGIKGGMDEVEFNHKKGFAFNGYLSKFFPPEKGISAKGYAEELKENFPGVLFTETKGGTASKPTNTETLLLPSSNLHEAYYIAKQLFNFPNEFEYPAEKGIENQVIKEKKYNNDTSTKLSTSSWTSELQITRKENAIVKIEYVYTNKGFSKFVTIAKEGDAIKISKTEIVE